ncbi:MAG: HAMP domain-containing sensor histidine kinase [Myxococcota bacterium]
MNKPAERALIARPLALCLGVGAVLWLNPNLRQGMLFVWLAAVFGGLNLLLWMGRRLRPVERVAPFASPAISLLGWGTLATFTLGLKSPILGAFFFEVVLGAVSMGPRGVVAVTAGAVAVLTVVQGLFGFAAGWQLLLLESAFLVVMGGLGYAMAQRRVTGEAALRAQSAELGERLEILQRQLEDERVVSRVGENVARLAHGLKNAVHSLRGFVALIEPEAERAGASRAALAGLRAAIDDLERLARLTLADAPASDGAELARAVAGRAGRSQGERPPARGAGPRAAGSAGTHVASVLERAIEELAAIHPKIEFALHGGAEHRALAVLLGATPLQELLTILLRNAVEAMHGKGACTVSLSLRDDRCRITIADQGEGLSPEAAARLFTPGFTTKAGGSGFGLFLARRIVEDQGGSLRLVPGSEQGAVAELELPLAPSPASSRPSNEDRAAVPEVSGTATNVEGGPA